MPISRIFAVEKINSLVSKVYKVAGIYLLLSYFAIPTQACSSMSPFVDRNVINIDITGDIGHFRQTEAIKVVALLPRRQNKLKLPELIKRAQMH